MSTTSSRTIVEACDLHPLVVERIRAALWRQAREGDAAARFVLRLIDAGTVTIETRVEDGQAYLGSNIITEGGGA